MNTSSAPTLCVWGDVIRLHPDEGVRRSLVLQIRDLSLRIFIPLGRLLSFSSSNAPRDPSLLQGSFLSQCYEEPLKHFEISQNLAYLGSILRIIEGDQLDRGDAVLLTLSRYFEALSVYGGTLTATHWVLDEDSTTLTIWSMLSYYQHCLDKFSGEYSHILDVIKGQLIQGFKRNAPVFRAIFECERLKEQRDYLVLECVELQIRKLYEQREKEIIAQGGKGVNVLGISAIMNFPECQALSDLKNKSMFSTDERRSGAEKIWKDMGLSDTDRDLIENEGQVFGIKQSINDLENKIGEHRASIIQKVERAHLNTVKRAIQGLYEYEQLEIVLACTQNLLAEKTASREVIIQWLVVLREGLKTVVADSTLNISLSQSLSVLSNLIKDIRDYFEHPEDYALKLDALVSSPKGQAQFQELNKDLFLSLQEMGTKIVQLIEVRLIKIRQILTKRAEIDPQDSVKAISMRGKKHKPKLADTREWVGEKYQGVQAFATRIVRKGQEMQTMNKAFLFIPSPHNTSPHLIVGHVTRASDLLRSLTSGLSRSELEAGLSEDVLFRLMAQRRISVATRHLKDLMNNLKAQPVEDSVYQTIEDIYFDARDVRNFQTHDVWRKDILGLVNAIYLLGFALPEALSLISSKPTPYGESSRESHVIEQVVQGTLTQASLAQAVQEGLNLNARDYKHRTLLHFLAEHPSAISLQMAKFIIDKGASVYCADHVQMSPLHYAAGSGFKALAHVLVEQGAVVDISSRRGTPTETAQQREHSELAQILSSYRGSRRSSNAKALLDAVESLDVSKVMGLVKEQHYDPLADFKGRLPLVALFEKEDADVDTQIQIATILLDARADINQQEPASGQTVLHAATQYSDDQKGIEFLMGYNPNINVQDDLERTPFHNAVCCRHNCWVNTLLAAGASVDTRDTWRYTPLLSASGSNSNNSQIVGSLLKYGANVEAENAYGRAIHHAVERGKDKVVALVLYHGASPFIKGVGGLYEDKLPYELSRRDKVTNRLFEKMRFLFVHLTPEDQETLIATTGLDESLFLGLRFPEAPTEEEEQVFRKRLYQRRFCWMS